MTTPITKSRLAVVIAAMLALSAAAPAVMAAGIDSETTNTPSTSEVTDGMTFASDFAGELPANYTAQITVSSTDPGLEVIDPDSGETIRTYTNSSDQVTQTYANSTSGTYYYNVTIEQDDLALFPIGAGETKNATLQVVDNETVDEINESTHNISVKMTAAGNYTLLRVGQSAAASDVVTFGDTGFEVPVIGMSLFANNYSTIEKTNVPINGSGSEVTLHLANSTAASDFDTAFDGFDAAGWSLAAPVQVNGNYHKVFLNSAPDSVNASGTYGVYDTSANTLSINIGDEYDGETSVDVTATGNNTPGWFGVSAYGFDALSQQIPGL